MFNRRRRIVFALFALVYLFRAVPVQAASEATLPLRPPIGTSGLSPLSLAGVVELARRNFPRILEQEAEYRASQRNISLRRVKEYLPHSMLSYQDVAATHNRLTQTVFSSSVLPTTPGPGPERVQMNADAFSAMGFIVDWDPVDFGLHRARIDKARAESNVSGAQLKLTVLEVMVQAANRFLEALVMREQVAVAQANVQRFRDFSLVVHAQVRAGLKPGADASLADSQLANAENDLIRARLNDELARASLAYAVGLGGEMVDINEGGLLSVPQPTTSIAAIEPQYRAHPLTLKRQALVDNERASLKVLQKEYYPRLRWLGGVNLRGSTFKTNRGDVPASDLSGVFPSVPNWNVGLMIDFPFLEIFRIAAEKKVVGERIAASDQALSLALQDLKTEEVKAQATYRASRALAANMPIQVQAAGLAARQAQARYEAGLGTVAQVAEANQILADSRVKEAVANVGVWKSLLMVSFVRGDLGPLLKTAAAVGK
ncbi:MAG: TolC family protein [Candidatus Obscuribacter sp.]|nr:TolC family protein [Candidatus Obscuribacter sp.]MBK9281267.1 TolC family protein [Candidatus Obscuribacter sp.]